MSTIFIGIGVLIICVWLWCSYRDARADRFTIRPLTPEERKEGDEFVNSTDDFRL